MSRQAHLIRLVTQRLSQAEPDRLPSYISSLSETLSQCGDVLGRHGQSGKDASDLTVQVHKLKTQISSLLQSKSCPGKWAAVILIKTVVEAGGLEVLQDAKPWVGGLLRLLAVRPFRCAFGIGV